GCRGRGKLRAEAPADVDAEDGVGGSGQALDEDGPVLGVEDATQALAEAGVRDGDHAARVEVVAALDVAHGGGVLRVGRGAGGGGGGDVRAAGVAEGGVGGVQQLVEAGERDGRAVGRGGHGEGGVVDELGVGLAPADHLGFDDVRDGVVDVFFSDPRCLAELDRQ